jgi:hypothetical protein
MQNGATFNPGILRSIIQGKSLIRELPVLAYIASRDTDLGVCFKIIVAYLISVTILGSMYIDSIEHNVISSYSFKTALLFVSTFQLGQLRSSIWIVTLCKLLQTHEACVFVLI